MIHPAELYNKARHHAFSMSDHSIDCVVKILREEYGSLPNQSLCGLIAELNFYHNYRKAFNLIPALDCGDKTDFVGFINKEIARIDVTTNPSFKKLANYDHPIEMTGNKYYLATVDFKTGNLIDLIPLNIPKSQNNGLSGRIIDVAILRGPDYDKDGCCKYNPYQELIRFDTTDYSIKKYEIVTDWYINDFGTLLSDMPDEFDDEKIRKEIILHGSNVARLLSKESDYNILGCLSYDYRIITPDGDGEYGFYIKWIHPLFESLGFKIGEELPLDI